MNPFDLDDAAAYRRWREWKLDSAPRRAEDLLVAVADPRQLTESEVDALAARCRVANMAFYAGPASTGENKEIPRLVGARFGLVELDANWLADEDGVSSITLRAGDGRQDFIPYTERPIRWHTDGYYNPPERQIRGMFLHCVRPAKSGGENAVMDHEIAYIQLRDRNPDFVRALFAPRAMSIPARQDETGDVRPEESGPVFSLGPQGDLQMRYTARTRSITWADDAATRAATGALQVLLDETSGPCRWIYRLRMAPGMGLICNNVLHDRTGFNDPPDATSGHRRLLYRARFSDRIGQTQGAWRIALAREERPNVRCAPGGPADAGG
jgi:alpha-ketoglutarate-dependent taurine dioxygenase